MSNLSRRQLLIFLGAATGAAAIAPFATQEASALGLSFLGRGRVTPLRLPHLLPAYAGNLSYLPASATTGTFGTFDQPLTSYQIFDDVVVSPEFERYVIIGWGDRVFPNPDDYFGYNCDWTGYRPISGTQDGYLFVNHEYVSFPISLGSPEAPASLINANPRPQTSYPLVVSGTPAAPGTSLEAPSVSQLARWGEFQYNQGGSVVRITRNASGRFQPISDPNNRRYHGLSGLGINRERTDLRPDGTPYNTITSWGNASHQQGDNEYLVGTGPAIEVFKISSDGLANRIIGTAFNCSGGYTPWGTVLTAEENFQGSPGAFFVGVQENVLPNGTQTGYPVGSSPTVTDTLSGQTFLNYTTGTFFGQVGEKYGWMVEIDPADRSFRGRKHTWLGRFRHENITMRTQPGRRLVAYMGDDRRSGHTWKYVSKGTLPFRVRFRSDSAYRDACSALLTDGQLYVARFNPPATQGGSSGTGRWVALALDAPVAPIAPSILSEVERAERPDGIANSNCRLRLPRRSGVAGQTVSGGVFDATLANEATSLPSYLTYGGTITSRPVVLGDYYPTLGAALVDAYPAANLIGGTPGARPEDLEVNPNNPSEVFIAYTDGAPGGDGYPDSRIFVVGKYTTAVTETQQSGGLYKIVETSGDGTGLDFVWERFEQAGESGSLEGGGFANVDNLAFDPQGNLWGVTDMTTSAHNGFNLTYSGAALTPGQTAITHDTNNTGTAGNLIGTFGNNWLFYVPLSGSSAGLVTPFAYGPPRCEITGPTFVGDTLIVAVQHPSEDSPMNGDPNAGGAAGSVLTRDIQMLDLAGGLYTQTRTLLRGSNWPSNIATTDGGLDLPNGPARPTVIGLRRKPLG